MMVNIDCQVDQNHLEDRPLVEGERPTLTLVGSIHWARVLG